jgi:hypothetical protein
MSENVYANNKINNNNNNIQSQNVKVEDND